MALCYYEILRVRPDASSDVIRRSYKRLAQQYHPDKHKSSEDSARQMAQINEAYAVISVAASRFAYDQKRRSLLKPVGADPHTKGRAKSKPTLEKLARKNIVDLFTVFISLVIIGVIWVNL